MFIILRIDYLVVNQLTNYFWKYFWYRVGTIGTNPHFYNYGTHLYLHRYTFIILRNFYWTYCLIRRPLVACLLWYLKIEILTKRLTFLTDKFIIFFTLNKTVTFYGFCLQWPDFRPQTFSLHSHRQLFFTYLSEMCVVT